MPEFLLPEITEDTPPPAAVAAREILIARRRLCQSIVEQFTALRGRLWFSHDASPAEILAALGTEAGGIFDDSAALVGFLLGTGRVAMEPAEYQAPREFTRKDDGTVTLK
jgi:hypothetical protein